MRVLLHLFGALISTFGMLIGMFVRLPRHAFRARRHSRGLLMLAALAAAVYYATRREKRLNPLNHPRTPPVIDI